MGKARMYGQKTTYIPNNKADMRYIKKLSSKRVEPARQRNGRKSG